MPSSSRWLGDGPEGPDTVTINVGSGLGSGVRNATSMSLKHPFQQIEELEQRIAEYRAVGDNDSLLEARIRQVALRMILVELHGAPIEPLINQHLELSLDYCKSNYIEQSFEHLRRAHQLVELHIFEEGRSQRTMVKIIATDGHIRYLQENYEDAFNRLALAERGCKEVLGERDILLGDVLELMGKCAIAVRDFPRAMECYENAWEIKEHCLGSDHDQTLNLWVLMADVHYAEGNMSEALEKMQTAITKMSSRDDQPTDLFDWLTKLAQWQERCDDIEGQGSSAALATLETAVQVAEDSYGESDAKVIKTKRDIALLNLKIGNQEQALEGLIQVEDLERKNFGSDALPCARTLKAIGTIYLARRNWQEAESCLFNALTIMQSHKCSGPLIREVKDKLKIAGAELEAAEQEAHHDDEEA